MKINNFNVYVYWCNRSTNYLMRVLKFLTKYCLSQHNNQYVNTINNNYLFSFFSILEIYLLLFIYQYKYLNLFLYMYGYWFCCNCVCICVVFMAYVSVCTTQLSMIYRNVWPSRTRMVCVYELSQKVRTQMQIQNS
jgi:hypothetical protein